MKSIEMIRTVHVGELYLKKGEVRSVSSELAERLVKEKSAKPSGKK